VEKLRVDVTWLELLTQPRLVKGASKGNGVPNFISLGGRCGSLWMKEHSHGIRRSRKIQQNNDF